MFLIFGFTSMGQSVDEIQLEAEKYYRDFINPTVQINHDLISWTGDIERDSITKAEIANEKIQNFKPSLYPDSAEKALENFLRLWEINPEKRHIIYYPIQQLGCYLNKNLDYVKFPEREAYFPIYEFTNLRKNWKCDYTIDYLFEMEMSETKIKHLENQLLSLDEPNLYKTKLNPNTVIYRFTWLRSFHHPIVVRIENNNDDYILYWKVGKGAGGYKPEGILKQGVNKMSAEEWETFNTLIDREDYNNIRNKQSMAIGDGATWAIEEKLPNKFRAKRTENPDTDLFRACMYLVKLAKLNIKESEIY